MIKFNLPGLYEHFDLNMQLLDDIAGMPEIFYPDIEIESFYGNFQFCIFDGGRIFCKYNHTCKEEIEFMVNEYNKRDIAVRLIFTNNMVQPIHYTDRFANLVLDICHNGKNEIVITNPGLEEYIRNKYPNFNIISSTTKCLNTKEAFIDELKKDYDLICLDYNLNNKFDFLNSLTQTEKDITNQFEILQNLKEQLVKIDVKKSKFEQDIDTIVNKLWDEYELTPNNVQEYARPENIQVATKKVNEYRNQIKALGDINVNSIEEYSQTKQRYDFMCEQRLDLEDSMAKLRKVISNMTSVMKEQFAEKFKIINNNFSEVFKELFGGGKAELILTDENNILECGIDINVQPPGKKLQSMSLLSGGEKAFTAIAILFAILKINPSPFCVLDEIEAALDDVNVYRYAEYLKKFTANTQFLVITHRKGTMEAADTVYGITMEENGISKLLSMKLK